VGLTKDAHRQVKKYSTGMKQRLSLAIALLGQPSLLMLDEPINGLDPSGIIEIRTLLTRLNRENGCTIFLSSHILDEIERICTDVAVIKEGLILYQGTMQGLIQRYQQERIKIETGDPAKAMHVLGVNNCSKEEQLLFVRINSRSDIPLIVNQLVSAGIEIYSVQADHSDLESSFLEVLQEGGGE
jgi:ABC-2 type transport system ATP-binding protein